MLPNWLFCPKAVEMASPNSITHARAMRPVGGKDLEPLLCDNRVPSSGMYSYHPQFRESSPGALDSGRLTSPTGGTQHDRDAGGKGGRTRRRGTRESAGERGTADVLIRAQ